jgi:hypothetical protein
MDDCEVPVTPGVLQAAEPLNATRAKCVPGAFHIGEHCVPRRLELREAIRNRSQRLGSPQNFVGVSDDAGPVETLDEVDDFGGSGAAANQVAGVDDDVGTNFTDVRDHRLKRGQISVDVGNDCDLHSRFRGDVSHEEPISAANGHCIGSLQ